MKKFSVRTLALLAMFTAVSIVLARLLGFYVTPSLRVSFEYFPIILAGVFFGPLAGAVVGGLADFIGATILSGLGFFPPLIVGPILAGLLAGLLSRYIFHNEIGAWWKVMVIVGIADLGANLLWGSFALSLMTGTSYEALLALRIIPKLVIAFVDAQFVFALNRALHPLILKTGRT
jgi:ECF transporter S component (folate family)